MNPKYEKTFSELLGNYTLGDTYECPKCGAEDIETKNKIECFETIGEIWCDLCFENWCENNIEADTTAEDSYNKSRGC